MASFLKGHYYKYKNLHPVGWQRFNKTNAVFSSCPRTRPHIFIFFPVLKLDITRGSARDVEKLVIFMGKAYKSKEVSINTCDFKNTQTHPSYQDNGTSNLLRVFTSRISPTSRRHVCKQAIEKTHFRRITIKNIATMIAVFLVVKSNM